MEIIEITADEVLKESRLTMGLPEATTDALDNALLAALLRRGVGILGPCSPATLASSVLESLQYLGHDEETLRMRVVTVIENLIVGGDLLELSQVTIDDSAAKGTWIFAAPPAFVARRNGSVFLVGLTPDDVAPVPDSLKARISHEGCARVIQTQAGEDLPAILHELGLLELSERTWLKTPKREFAGSFLETMTRRLEVQPASGTTDDIEIIDPTRSVDYYRGRWTKPRRESGIFIARRPQLYGAPIWGFAQFENGTLAKFLDFPLKGTRWRGCDVAWHLQMAIDHCRGTPQQYRKRSEEGGAYLDFFSPIPLWAQRRLALFGRPVAQHKSLFSYWLPDRELASEEEFLQNYLWLSKTNKTE